MDGSIRFGVLLPTGKAQWGEGTDPRELIDFAVRAEALGYASVWANDSVLSPRIETLVMLAAVAPLTTRVTLGTAALLPVLRRPVQAAQALASLDLLTGGRLAVGVGAGFPGRFGVPLHTLSEVPWPGRFARLDDTVALWRQLWASQVPTSFHGKVLHFDELPRGLGAVPAGGPAHPARRRDAGGARPHGPAVRRLAALPAGPGRLPDRPAGGAPSGRRQWPRPSAITPALFVTVLISDEVDGGRRALDEYSRANYGPTLDALQSVQAVIAGPPARVASRLGRYIAAGPATSCAASAPSISPRSWTSSSGSRSSLVCRANPLPSSLLLDVVVSARFRMSRSGHDRMGPPQPPCCPRRRSPTGSRWARRPTRSA